MPKAKKKTKGVENLKSLENMDSQNLSEIKDYLRKKGGRLTGMKKELLHLAKCYEIHKEDENPSIIAQWETILT